MSRLRLTEGENAVIRVYFKDSDGSAINLTGSTAQLAYQIRGGTAQLKTMLITDGANGQAEYKFAVSELKPGYMVVRPRRIAANGDIKKANETFDFVVEPAIL